MADKRFLKLLTNICVCLFLLEDSTVFCQKSAATRTVTLQHNPDCDIPECKTTTNTSNHIVYARAKGTNDSLHYIFSTVASSPPTLLLLRSSDNYATLNVDWKRLLSASTANLTGAIRLVSGDKRTDVRCNIENAVMFDRVLEYNDSRDDAIYNTSLAFSPILLHNLLWDFNASAQSFLMTGVTTKYDRSFSSDSKIFLNVSIFGHGGQADILPSLPHNENTSDWDFVLSNLLTRGNGSRFAVEMVTLRDGSNIAKSRQKSINDEYSPAVFTTEKIEWTNAKTQSPETFSQWRAVSYTVGEHQRKFSTDVDTLALDDVNVTSSLYKKDILQNRLLCAYFGLERLDNMTANSVIIAFGQPDDGFYAATNYLSWTSSIGFAVPPSDSFSTLVICMLFAGVGCPMIVIIVGGFYVLVLRMKRKRSPSGLVKAVYDYQPIQ